MAGIAKKAYDVARRPENQAKMRQAVDRFKQSRTSGAKGGAKRRSR